jgi:branched-chain amino acid transport system substrate-binding protein
LNTTTFQPCQQASECQASFGVGWSCGASGYCEHADSSARCSQTFPTELFAKKGATDAIVIGSISDHSIESHLARDRAVELALRQINQAGGVDSLQFGLVSCDVAPGEDGLSTVEAAEESARYLAQIGVPAVIGPMSGEETAKAFPILAERDVLLMSPAVTSSTLTALELEPSDDAPGLLWRTVPPSAVLGEAIAHDLGVVQNVVDAAVIYDSGAEGTALYQSFTNRYPVAIQGLDYEGTGYNAHAATAADRDTTDVVLLSSDPEAIVDFLRTASGLEGFIGDDPKTVFLTDAATEDAVLGADLRIFSQTRGVRFAPPDINNVVFRDFKTAYQAQYGDDPGRHAFAANAYDAGWMVALGAAGASLSKETLTGSNIARRLRRMSAGTEVAFEPANWGAALDLVRENASMNIRGASGDLDYNAAEEPSARIQYWSLVRENDAWAVRGTHFYVPPQ